MLMKSAYLETATLWRVEPTFPLLILGQAVIAFAFTGLYVSKVGVNSAYGLGLWNRPRTIMCGWRSYPFFGSTIDGADSLDVDRGRFG